MRPHRRVGAGVQSVVDAVAVGVGGAALGVHDRARGCAGTGIFAVGDAVAVEVTRFAAQERRQPQRAHDVTGPAGAERGLGIGRVEAAHLEPQGDAVREEDPVAQGAVHGVVREAIGRGALEVEPRVPAEEVEKIALGAEVEDQARAAEAQLR